MERFAGMNGEPMNQDGYRIRIKAPIVRISSQRVGIVAAGLQQAKAQ
jgi:hypothetical protein